MLCIVLLYCRAADYPIYERTIIVPDPLRHGASSALMLIEIFLVRIPVVTYHAQLPLLWCSGCFLLMWIWNVATKLVLYKVLMIDDPLSIVFFLAFLVLLMGTFAGMYGLAWMRERYR